jgi:hypothetical protein
MHRHIEPALKAWQAAWASNPHHSKCDKKSSLARRLVLYCDERLTAQLRLGTPKSVWLWSSISRQHTSP